MAAFCFHPRRAWTLEDSDDCGVRRVANQAQLDAWLAPNDSDDRLVCVVWTAGWSALADSTRAAVEQLDVSEGTVARFAIAEVDDLPDAAMEWAVHDLPSLHVFHGGSLVPVERLSGLFAVRHIAGPLLQCHADLAAAAVSEEAGEASAQATLSPWPEAAACLSPAAVSAASSADGSCCGEPAPASACPAFERRHSGASTASLASERSYKPQYIRTLRRQPGAAAPTAAGESMQRLPCVARSISLGSAVQSPGGRTHLLVT